MIRYFKILCLLFVVLLLLNCSGSGAGKQGFVSINIKGSDTMLPLTELLAAEYMKLNPGISIYVEGGGTGSGVDALISGGADIATASRSLKPEEAKKLADYYGSLGMYFLIARDALNVYVNRDNRIKNFSMEDLHNIFTCKVTNWKELGGEDKDIIPVIRTPNSGTYLYFQEHVLEGTEYCNSAVVKSTTESVAEFIGENENAIGYGGISSFDDIYYATIEGIEASEQNARNDTYPITRYLHFFTSRTPKGIVKNFIDWVISPEGQKIIKQEGFIPLWEISY